jgi:hypothetical protein
MIRRIAQRQQNDCAICVVAMLMAPIQDYDRVYNESSKYEKNAPGSKYYAWWESYLTDNGFHLCYRPFIDLYEIPRFGGLVVGLLGMDMPQLRSSHIVCVDEIGVVDPADGAPDHAELAEYVVGRSAQGAIFHKEFLAVARRPVQAANARSPW